MEKVASIVITALAGMSKAEKTFALALLVHNLTISSRAVYADLSISADTIDKLYVINEMIHSLSAQLMHLASGDNLVSDEDLVQTLCNLASQKCEIELTSAVKYSFSMGES